MSYNTPKTTCEASFTFPPSVQSDLFSWLKPEQQAELRPVLRVLKRPAQEELCYSLMDYLETGEKIPPQEFLLKALFNHFVSQWSPLHVTEF